MSRLEFIYKAANYIAARPIESNPQLEVYMAETVRREIAIFTGKLQDYAA